jgi:hypothetical protein
MCRGDLAYGHFILKSRPRHWTTPKKLDTDIFPEAKRVYRVESYVLYDNVVALSDKEFSKRRVTPPVSPERFKQIVSLGLSTVDATSGGPKQPNTVLRIEVEKAAVKVVWDYFEGQDYELSDCSKDNLGWDLEATLGAQKLLLEVKGLSGSALCIELTPNEFEKMETHKLNWRLCVVTDALTAEPRLAVFSYNVENGLWQDGAKRVLAIEPRMGARCRLE